MYEAEKIRSNLITMASIQVAAAFAKKEGF
jgi:hypothetical protein